MPRLIDPTKRICNTFFLNFTAAYFESFGNQVTLNTIFYSSFNFSYKHLAKVMMQKYLPFSKKTLYIDKYIKSGTF